MFVLKKRNKWMRGHSYVTGFPTKYAWEHSLDNARRFYTRQEAEPFAHATGAHIIEVPVLNKREEKQRRKRLVSLSPRDSGRARTFSR